MVPSMQISVGSVYAYMASPTGIEPVSRASETLILSIELRRGGGYILHFTVKRLSTR